MANGILSPYSNSDVNMFQKDFSQIIRVAVNIDKHFGSGNFTVDNHIDKFEKLVEDFNKKYKGVKLKLKKGIDALKVKFFIKQKDVKEFFAESASKIQGLKSVGRNNPNQIMVSDAEQFASFLDTIIDKAYLSFLDVDNGICSFGAILDRIEKMIELQFSPEEVINENSAIFKVCAFYALKNSIDRKIDIHSDALTFGFSNLLNEIEKREWLEKYNPPFLR